MSELDTKYSRQTLVYGEHSTKKLKSLSVMVCILNQSGVDMAYECCKNLMLTGIGSLHLYDDRQKIAAPSNLQKRILELNPEVDFQISNNIEEKQSTLDVLVLCGGCSPHEVIHYNSVCRQNQTWFIAAQLVDNRKMVLWQDPGELHSVQDIDGQPCVDMLLLHVENTNPSWSIHVDQIDDMLRVADQLQIQSEIFYVKAIHPILNQIEIKKTKEEGHETTTLLVESGSYGRRIPRKTTLYGKCMDDTCEWQNADSSTHPYALSSYVGAVLSQEVLKQLGTFIPSIGYSEYNLLPASFQPSSYNNKPISHMTIFVVGAGALGCELLKGLAEMIVNEQEGGSSHTGRIIITDMDAIELSNLSRQFLYRESDIGKLKAPTAAQAIREIYPGLNIEGRTNAVCAETATTLFGKDFWNTIDIVITAVDNVDARLFVDEQCRWYRKPLIDSGTLGLKGSVQVILPDLTETYSDSRDPPTKTVPVCVLKQYPYRIEHCIQWAQEKMATPQILNCKAWFQTDIQDILRQHPPNDRNEEDGALFWSGSRRCPTPLQEREWSLFEIYASTFTSEKSISFDKDNDKHFKWVWHAANLRAKIYNIPECTKIQCRGIAGNIIPAVASTTSAVIGLVCLELQKWLNHAEVSQHCNSYMNLGEGHGDGLIQSEPLPPVEMPGEETLDPHLGCMVRTWNNQPSTCWSRLKLELPLNSTYTTVKSVLEQRHDVTIVGMSTMYTENGIDYNDTNPKSYDELNRVLKENAVESLVLEAEDLTTGNVVHFPIIQIHVLTSV